MSLFDKKQQLGQGNIRGKPEKTTTPQEKKPSLFGKKGYLERSEVRWNLKKKKNDLYRMGMKGSEVDKLAEEITDYKKFGSFIGPKNIEEYEKMEKKRIEGIKNLNERGEAKRKLGKKMKALRGVLLGEK